MCCIYYILFTVTVKLKIYRTFIYVELCFKKRERGEESSLRIIWAFVLLTIITQSALWYKTFPFVLLIIYTINFQSQTEIGWMVECLLFPFILYHFMFVCNKYIKYICVFIFFIFWLVLYSLYHLIITRWWWGELVKWNYQQTIKL